MSTQVNILVTDSQQTKLDQLQKSLRDAGLKKIQYQQAIGIITGEFDGTEAQAKARLGKVAGVAAVEVSQSYQIPPPDSNLQ